MGQARHLDTSIVLGNDSDIVLNDPLAEIFPSLVCFRVGRLSGSRLEDIGPAEVRAEELGYFWPSHEFVDGEELE